MCKSSPAAVQTVSLQCLLKAMSTGQGRKPQCLNGMKKNWSQSFNLSLVDHCHYLQSVLYIMRGFIFALQKLSLIMCYLQIAADLHSSL